MSDARPSEFIPEFFYRVGWRASAHRPGRHAGARLGGDFAFHGHAPLALQADARKLDVRASLLDPWGGYVVRTYHQQSIVPVVVVADVSASMGFSASRGKLETLCRFAESVAWSAYRSGDPFCLIGCDDQVRAALYQPLSRRRGGAGEAAARIAGWKASGRSARGLLEAQGLIGRQRALVFVFSDFHFPLDFAAEVLDSLGLHRVVPVIAWSPDEFTLIPNWRYVTLQDAETGTTRFLWMRPRLQRKLAEHRAARAAALSELCRSRGSEPLWFAGEFNADAVSDYFLRVGHAA